MVEIENEGGRLETASPFCIHGAGAVEEQFLFAELKYMCLAQGRGAGAAHSSISSARLLSVSMMGSREMRLRISCNAAG